jgi:UPF0271 protein
MTIDLNADLGEGAGTDAELLQMVTSANVCCGGHAGDPDTVRVTLQLAKAAGVRVGVHPGHPDRDHFGRRELELSPDRVFNLVSYQAGAVAGLARAVGLHLWHLKPHGGLYHQACREVAYAKPVAAAAFVAGLSCVGLPGSALQRACAALAVPFLPEGFADRRYRPDGTLVPRSEPDALVHDPAEAVEQVRRLIDRGVKTICVHGDGPDAVRFATAVRHGLEAAGCRIQPADP